MGEPRAVTLDRRARAECNARRASERAAAHESAVHRESARCGHPPPPEGNRMSLSRQRRQALVEQALEAAALERQLAKAPKLSQRQVEMIMLCLRLDKKLEVLPTRNDAGEPAHPI